MCSGCGHERPEEMFRVSHRTGKRVNPCSACSADRQRKKRHADPELANTKERVRYKRDRERIRKRQSGYIKRHGAKWAAASRRKRAEDPVEHTKTAFRAMWQRCTNPKKSNYKYYGGRGITVCERWRVFDNFVSDVGLRPRGLTIDRIDNYGNYEPGNVRWATWEQQRANRRKKAA